MNGNAPEVPLDGIQVASHGQAGQTVVTKEASQGTLNDFILPCEP